MNSFIGISRKSREFRLSLLGDLAFVSPLTSTTFFLPAYGIPEFTWLGISYSVTYKSHAINSK